jgi:glycosyltransferase involved in cell wall biosynthesis
VPESEVPAIFRRATVVALPYRQIDQSGVLMTALAFEKPVLATRVGGFAETIQHAVHGYVSEPGDVAGLASNLETALGDPNRHTMRKSIRELKQGYLSWDYAAQRTIEVYDSVARTSNSSTKVATASSPRSMPALSVSADE